MTSRSVTPLAVVSLFCALVSALLLVGPGVGSASAGGEPAPAREPACDPGELERAAGTHSNGLVPFSVIASGAIGGRREAGVGVVSDRTGWEELKARGIIEEETEAPDFSESAVLVVHAGHRPTAGYAVRVTRIRLVPRTAEEDAWELAIDAVVEGPPEGSMAATVVTSPYAVVTLPAEAAGRENITIDFYLP